MEWGYVSETKMWFCRNDRIMQLKISRKLQKNNGQAPISSALILLYCYLKIQNCKLTKKISLSLVNMTLRNVIYVNNVQKFVSNIFECF